MDALHSPLPSEKPVHKRGLSERFLVPGAKRLQVMVRIGKKRVDGSLDVFSRKYLYNSKLPRCSCPSGLSSAHRSAMDISVRFTSKAASSPATK